MTLTPEEIRQDFDRCLQSVEDLVYELRSCDWTKLGEDGTFSSITLEISHLRKRLLLNCVATQTSEERHLIFAELLRSARKAFPATFEHVLASYFRRNFAFPATLKEDGRKANHRTKAGTRRRTDRPTKCRRIETDPPGGR